MNALRSLDISPHAGKGFGTLAFICLLYLFVWQLYAPGFSGVFMMDDEPSLSSLNVGGGVTSFQHAKQFILGNSSGELGRPVSMASFLIDDQYWAGSPKQYKTTNFQFHVLTSLLVLWLVFLLARQFSSDRKALFCASVITLLWATHPMHVSTVLYVVQRMTILMSLFSVVAIIFYLYARSNFDLSPRKSLLLLLASGIATGLAVLSKENGVLVFLYILVLEATIFGRENTNARWWWLIRTYCGVPLLILLGYFLLNWEKFLLGYNSRSFGMWERVLTEQRILLEYLWQILLPQPSVGSLVHDDYVVSQSVFQPFGTAIAIGLNAAAVVLSILFRHRVPVLACGVLWFYGGHFIESTFIGLELYFEHRNYLPMLGPVAALVYYFWYACRLLNARMKRVLIGFAALFLLWSGAVTHQVTSLWGEPSVLYRVWAEEHPNSPRAQRILGQLLYAENKPEEALQQLFNTHQKFPNDVGVLIEAINISCSAELPPPFPMEWLYARLEHGEYVDGLTYYVEDLSKTVSAETCYWFSEQDFLNLVEKLKSLPKLRGEARAKILLWGAHLYIERGNLNGAMLMLDDAFSKFKNPSIPVLQAKLLISAGLYAEARQFLDKAQILIERKPIKFQLLKSEVESLLMRLEKGKG